MLKICVQISVVSVGDPPPYSEDIVLIKHECVGHVQKRKGMTLQKWKKSGIGDETDIL